MSSTNTYTNTIPYFYIIQHTISKKMYAGSRWAKNCNPSEFMILGGYTTSSTLINSLIQSEGLSIFEILRIDTYCDNMHVYDYETNFLSCLNCAKLDDWYNFHNNTGMAFGTEKFKIKAKNTLQEKYGVNHPAQCKEIRNKAKNTYKEKYGVEYPSQRKECKEKSKATSREKFGVDNAMQNQEIKDKLKISNQKKFGVDNVFQSEEIKKRIKQSNIIKFGVDNPAKIKFLSIIFNKKTYSKNAITRWYPEFKQYY